MSQERKQILTMLAEGKITADEAERLLEKIEPMGTGMAPEEGMSDETPSPEAEEHEAAGEERDEDDRSGRRRHSSSGGRSHSRRWWGHPPHLTDHNFPFGPRRHGPSAAPKYLRVQADTHDGDKVNVRIPIALLRTGMKLSTVIPPHAQEKLNEKGIDLSGLSGLKGEELIDALRELNVDVVTADGDKVRIFCE